MEGKDYNLPPGLLKAIVKDIQKEEQVLFPHRIHALLETMKWAITSAITICILDMFNA